MHLFIYFFKGKAIAPNEKHNAKAYGALCKKKRGRQRIVSREKKYSGLAQKVQLTSTQYYKAAPHFQQDGRHTRAAPQMLLCSSSAVSKHVWVGFFVPLSIPYFEMIPSITKHKSQGSGGKN